MNAINKKVAFLATGDEIICGQILNTNARTMAETLNHEGIEVGNHLASSDEEADISRCILFLLETHDALIITGGLGPTSDDRTRLALSAATKKPLLFDAASWDHVVSRLHSLGLSAPESNKQQAYFPEGAQIFNNANGTANACALNLGEKIIFMLPGPPTECLPIFEKHTLPLLKQHAFVKLRYFKSWLLFGVSEGHLSEVLDQIPMPVGCRLGYRIQYPYLEIKIYADKEKEFQALLALIEPHLKEKVINTEHKKASEKLLDLLRQSKKTMVIDDHATGGRLASTLYTPMIHPHLRFSKTADPQDLFISIAGLKEYWLQEKNEKSQINIAITHAQKTTEKIYHIPYNNRKNILLYAVEFICQQLIQCIDHT